MLTLYHAPQSRSTRIIWLLEELGVDYRIETVSIRRLDRSATPPREIGGPDPANPHPHHKVPAIVHDGALVYESAAVVLYLTDAFPEAKLGPLPGEPLRGPYVSWLAYYGGVLEPAASAAFFGFESRIGGTLGWAPFDEVLAHVDAALERGPHMLGEAFSGADILYGSTFALFMGSPLVARTEARAAYVERLTSRPAHRRALELDGEPG